MENFIKKIFLLIIVIVLSSTVFSQERKLEIVHIESGEVKYIYENKRVVLKTIAGEKYKGRLFFTDDSLIQIKESTIMLEDIFSINKNPLAKSIIQTTIITI